MKLRLAGGLRGFACPRLSSQRDCICPYLCNGVHYANVTSVDVNGWRDCSKDDPGVEAVDSPALVGIHTGASPGMMRAGMSLLRI